MFIYIALSLKYFNDNSGLKWSLHMPNAAEVQGVNSHSVELSTPREVQMLDVP